MTYYERLFIAAFATGLIMAALITIDPIGWMAGL